jgi:hypothetical protein
MLWKKNIITFKSYLKASQIASSPLRKKIGKKLPFANCNYIIVA